LNSLVLALVLVGQLVGQTEKVEEVSFDDLEEDAAPKQAAPSPTPDQKGQERVEEVTSADLAFAGATPEYDTRPWLSVLPLILLLIVMWNVDWRDARAKAQIAVARARRAPPVKVVQRDGES